MGGVKRFGIFLLVLAVALGGLYFWWQRNAVRIITDSVQSRSRNLVRNPEQLTVEVPKPVRMTGLREAVVPKLLISGKDLVLKDGPKLASVKIELNDVAVSGPPFHFTGVTRGTYRFAVTDKEVTAYLRTRGVNIASLVKISLETITVKFSRAQGTTLLGQVEVPVIGTRIPLSVNGSLVPSSTNGQVNFKVGPAGVKVSNAAVNVRSLRDSVDKLNPVITVAEWPFLADLDIETRDGMVIVSGKITGIMP